MTYRRTRANDVLKLLREDPGKVHSTNGRPTASPLFYACGDGNLKLCHVPPLHKACGGDKISPRSCFWSSWSIDGVPTSLFGAKKKQRNEMK